MSAALEVRGITASYQGGQQRGRHWRGQHKGTPVLNGVSFSVAAGQVLGLIGPNGAGKSTLLDVVCGGLRPSSGSVLLFGRDITRLSTHRRAALGLGRTFQRLEPFTSLSVADNLLVAAEAAVPRGSRDSRDSRGSRDSRLSDGAPAATPQDLVHGLLKRFGLVDFAERPVGTVPTGIARTVEIARALAAGARVLLLDEPSSGMSGEQVREFAASVRALRDEGLCIVLVEHDEDLVAAVCDPVYELSREGGWRPAPSRSG